MEKLKCGGLKKHVVLKIEDVEKYLHDYQRNELAEMCGDIEYGRKRNGENVDNEYLVINTDEPYADEVIEILKKNGHWG